ncbi:N-acetylmuramate alpha-1-phosphate uridylyltransferase MurU [Ramlibacter sp.]|uniref:N-acetylmuramate alpha-1-phosphate uridylyltransferase MurU n=1 Tax=Ramlibacter sp. TaxID=1917967 RepID=UPI003D13B5AE
MNARAMVLAAGRGERMRPLTDTSPKPLLEVRGRPLMQYHLDALARSGIDSIAINTAWLGEQIEARFGATHAGAALRYSHEGRDFGGALETAGGIARALPLLAECFWVVAGDVFVPGFEFSADALRRFERSGKLAHLYLVRNPDHNPKGDFGLAANAQVLSRADEQFTYSTIGLYRQSLFASIPHGNPAGIKAALAPLLRAAMADGQVTGELYEGEWTDVGTPQRLAALNSRQSLQ